MAPNLALAIDPDRPERRWRPLIGAGRDPAPEPAPPMIVAHERRGSNQWRRFHLVRGPDMFMASGREKERKIWSNS